MPGEHLIASRSRLVGMCTFDIGEIRPLEEVRRELLAREPALPLEFLVRNANFFDQESSKPILRSESNGHSRVEVVVPNTARVPSRYSEAVTSACAALEGAGFREVVYISASGVGCLIYVLDVDVDLDTTALILATNAITKYSSRLTLSNGTEFCAKDRVDEWLCRLRQFREFERTDYRREYSLIHLLELDAGCRDQAAKSGASIYDTWENEWHALSVRTIENWQDRYPKGLKYDEPNQAVSPAAVLKINMRNTVIYEFPYSKTEVEDCYYPVMIEARMWDMLVTSQLQSIQRTIAQYEDEDFAEVSGSVFKRLKKSALKTFNEFDGYYLSTSKRTRNLYDAAYHAFQTKQLLGSLEKKIDQLDVLLSDIHEAMEAATGKQVASRQRDLLEQAQEGADQERASKSLLSFVGVVTGLSLAISIAQVFKLSNLWALILMAALLAMFGIIYGSAKPDRRRLVAFRGENRVLLNAPASEISDALAAAYGQRLVEVVRTGAEQVSFVVNLAAPNQGTRVRAELIGRVADSSDPSNGILRLEATAAWPTGHQKPDLAAQLKSAAAEMQQLSKGAIALSGSLE